MFIGNSPLGTGDLLLRVDIMEKSSIKKIEQAVKRKTGLDWFVIEVRNNIISWEILLPIRGGKIHIKAQSNTETPTELYGFQIGEEELFMLCLRQIAQKK